MTPQLILRFIHGFAWPLSDEKRLQDEIERQLTAAAVPFGREVRLSAKDIVDFMIGDIALEVKIKGGRREIYRQIERYCAFAEVKALVLATNVATGMPRQVGGKPVFVASLGRGHL